MPNHEERLHLFEALALRDEYDQRVALLEKLLDPENKHKQRNGFLYGKSDSEELLPVAGFAPEQIERERKKLKTRRVKLNQEIQIANFRANLTFDGDEISLAEALEVRKALLAERDELAQRVLDSAYQRVLHKEERDVIKAPLRSFEHTYAEYHTVLGKLRQLLNAIQQLNHQTSVAFRDE